MGWTFFSKWHHNYSLNLFLLQSKRRFKINSPFSLSIFRWVLWKNVINGRVRATAAGFVQMHIAIYRLQCPIETIIFDKLSNIRHRFDGIKLWLFECSYSSIDVLLRMYNNSWMSWYNRIIPIYGRNYLQFYFDGWGYIIYILQYLEIDNGNFRCIDDWKCAHWEMDFNFNMFAYMARDKFWSEHERSAADTAHEVPNTRSYACDAFVGHQALGVWVVFAVMENSAKIVFPNESFFDFFLFFRTHHWSKSFFFWIYLSEMLPSRKNIFEKNAWFWTKRWFFEFALQTKFDCQVSKNWPYPVWATVHTFPVHVAT